MKKQLPLLIILVLAVVFISACTKIVATDIGGDILPPIDGVVTKEMYLDVTTKNSTDTTVKVGIGTPNALGYISNDPLFGKTTASINVELKPSTFPVTFPVSKDSLFIDSVVLVMGYTGAWGDTLSHLRLHVYEVQNTDPGVDFLRADTVYSTNYNLQRGRELTENNVAADIDITKLNDVDSLFRYNDIISNQVRIKLGNFYGEELLKNYDTSSTGAYHNDSLFQRFFKGYQIVPEQTGNALLRMNLLDTNTQLAIYYRYTYRDSLNGKQDTTVRYWGTNNYNCGTSNYVIRDRSGTPIPSYIPPNTNTNDSLLFIDVNPGIYTKVAINGLDTLSNKIIHRAELVMEQVPGDPASDALFTVPNLFLTPYSTDSMRRFALPYDVTTYSGTVTNQISYGCFPNKKIDPATQQTISFYTFDISRYVQGIITRHENIYPLILYAPSNDYIYPTENALYQVYTGSASSSGAPFPLNAPAMGRIRLGGGSSVNHKMQLHIVYSNIK